MKNKKQFNTKIILILALITVLVAAVISGCSRNPEVGIDAEADQSETGGEGGGEHGGEGGEHGGGGSEGDGG